MSNQNEIRVVLGSLRYASNTNKSVWVQAPLFSNMRQYVEGDRNILVDQQVIFDNERQGSDKFRIAGKITNIIDNSITGKTSYTPFKNDLYYTNPVQNAINSINNPSLAWDGYPQYNEFAISRSNGINGHIPFVSKSATTYNWSFYMSYVFSSTTSQKMSYTNEKFGVTNNSFVCGDGIPYVIESGTSNGKPLVYFYCATNHNLLPGQYVELSTPINNKNVFVVYSIGDGTYRSEENVFAIYNLRFLPSDIQTGTYGTFKRIVNLSNSAETKSRYYVRLHKIIKTPNECNISKAGFENNPFLVKSKVEYTQLTPNQTERISVKDGTQTFSFTFDSDVNISGLMDNNGKPISEIFVTIINRGYMGWFNLPAMNQNGIQTGLEIGWNFNFLKNSTDNWWLKSLNYNKDNIPVNSYVKNNITFYYNDYLNNGDIIKGDFCEYNDIEQKEYVLSKMVHKYSFNKTIFNTNQLTKIPSGYLYNPHHSIKIRVFSDYIESISDNITSQIPGYAWHSEYNNTWYWRDIYTYGFIDNDGLGVDYPFINGAHYPFSNLLFLQYPINRNINNQSIDINDPLIDNCE